MTHKILHFPQAPRVMCVWHTTGDSRMPLACTWSAAEQAGAAAVPVLDTSDARGRLCA